MMETQTEDTPLDSRTLMEISAFVMSPMFRVLKRHVLAAEDPGTAKKIARRISWELYVRLLEGTPAAP